MKVSPLCDKWIKNSWFQQAQHNLRIDLLQKFWSAVPDLNSFFFND